MAVETKFVVTREGKEIGVFATQQEAEAFEAMADRAEKLTVVLTATAHEHGLDMEIIPVIARALAGREKDMLSIFNTPVKGKGKAKAARAPKAARKPKVVAAPSALPEATPEAA